MNCVKLGDKVGSGPIFGHLIVLLRDWHTTDGVYELLFDAEDEATMGDDAVKARTLLRAAGWSLLFPTCFDVVHLVFG